MLTLYREDIYRHGKNLKKHPNYSVMSHKIPSTLSLHEEPVHSQKKKALGKILTPSWVQKYEPGILELVCKFCSCLMLAGEDNLLVGQGEKQLDGWTMPRNMAEWCKQHFLHLLLLPDLLK